MVSISIKITVPAGTFKKRGFVNAIKKAQRQQTVPGLKKLFKQTTFGWSNKPDFGWVQQSDSNSISISMYPQGQYADRWTLVNTGSPRHRIPKSGSTYMRFRPGYRAATTPGSLMSRRAYRSGAYVVRYVIADHPGFEARDFVGQIAEQYTNPFLSEMQEVINSVARK